VAAGLGSHRRRVPALFLVFLMALVLVQLLASCVTVRLLFRRFFEGRLDDDDVSFAGRLVLDSIAAVARQGVAVDVGVVRVAVVVFHTS